MDIKIKENGFRFKFRVAGLVKQNNNLFNEVKYYDD